MGLQDLPEEIILIIVKKLDQKSVVNLYDTCQQIRNVICGFGGFKTLKMSMNAHATVSFMKTNFFISMAHHIRHIDMSGVPDLNKTALVPAMKKLKTLIKLDVSFTNINLLDLIAIYSACPTIKDVTINFAFPKTFFVDKDQSSIDGSMAELTAIFKEFDNVHFIGSDCDKLVGSLLPEVILEKATLKSLKFTINSIDFNYSIDYQRPVTDWQSFNTERFDIFLLNWKDQEYTYNYDITNCPFLDHVSGYEFIVISMPNLYSYTIYITPIFESLFKNKLNVKANVVEQLTEGRLFGNIAIMCWSKQFNGFNDMYFSSLAKDLQQYFPKCLDYTESRFLGDNEWFYSTRIPDNIVKNVVEDVVECHFKKRRVAHPSLCLNYDSKLKDTTQPKLSLSFDTDLNYVSLSPGSDYLRKLTFLSLTGPVRYNLEFFNILFRCCINLETLNVQGSKFSPCAFPISRSLPLSRTMKNLRLIDKCIDFNTLFSSLSQCSTLENIQINDISAGSNEIGNPVLVFEKCVNLYCFSIKSAMSDNVRSKRLKLFNELKAKYDKPFLHIELISNEKFRLRTDKMILYDPFISVFHVNPIKPF